MNKYAEEKEKMTQAEIKIITKLERAENKFRWARSKRELLSAEHEALRLRAQLISLGIQRNGERYEHTA